MYHHQPVGLNGTVRLRLQMNVQGGEENTSNNLLLVAVHLKWYAQVIKGFVARRGP